MSIRVMQTMAAILVAIVLIFSVSIYIVSRNNYRENLRNTLEFTSSHLSQCEVYGQSFEELAKKSENRFYDWFGSALRITVVSAEGELLYDTYPEADERREKSRKEVVKAFSNNGPVEVERFDEAHHKSIYLAQSNPEKSLVVRTSAIFNFGLKALWPILVVMFIGLVIGVLLTYCIVNRMTQNYRSSVSAVEMGLKNLAEGQFDTRLSEIKGASYDEIRTLTDQFNDTATFIQNKHDYTMKRLARLNTILNTMIDPLLMVDANKNLLYINQQAMRVFGRELNPEDKPYPQVLLTHSEELDWLLDECIQASTDIDTIIPLTTVEGVVRFKVLVSPSYIENEPQGVVVALHDLTVEEEASAFRRDFVANVTHELKTPLTSIRGFIETLSSMGNIKKEQALRFLEIMDVEAQRLEVLIDDILSLSEIERGKVKHISEFDLSELIDEVIVLLDEQASEKKVAVFTEQSLPPTFMVRAERDRIKQILINLVDNAIKYNYENGRVSVNAHRLASGNVQLMVQDNGPGIAEEAQKRVFERFYRVDTSRSRGLGGTGLGLSIVKHIAQLYDGTAEVESTSEEGTRFIITMKI